GATSWESATASSRASARRSKRTGRGFGSRRSAPRRCPATGGSASFCSPLPRRRCDADLQAGRALPVQPYQPCPWKLGRLGLLTRLAISYLFGRNQAEDERGPKATGLAPPR